MWLVLLGLVLLGLKWAAIDPVAAWAWWWVLSPFGLAVLWWHFADEVGITQRRAMERQDERARLRRESQFENLGLRPPKSGARKPKSPKDGRP
jgi:small Trp-rich protein